MVADFGAAHFEQEDLYTLVETAPTSRLANFQYAAPEQRVRGRVVDLRADIYALGVILNELFTGTLLQGSGYKTIGSVAPEFGYLDALVEQMVRQDPADRPSSLDQIKSELIARKNDFVTQQRISELKNAVVPVREVDDAIVADPIRLVGLDYRPDGVLILKLSQSVNATWVQAFQNIGNYSALMGHEPSRFTFNGDTALMAVGEQYVQQIVDHFKNYLATANSDYERLLTQQQRRAEDVEWRRLQNELAREEQRKRILDKVKV